MKMAKDDQFLQKSTSELKAESREFDTKLREAQKEWYKDTSFVDSPALRKHGDVWHVRFRLNGKLIEKTTGQQDKRLAHYKAISIFEETTGENYYNNFGNAFDELAKALPIRKYKLFSELCFEAEQECRKNMRRALRECRKNNTLHVGKKIKRKQK